MGLIGVVAIIAIGLYWLLYTESALHWTINKLTPQITATSVEGSITELSFTGLSIELETAEIDISSGNFSWTPADLLSRSLRIEHIEASGVNISTNADQAEKSTEPQDINLPFALILERIRLNDILLTLTDNSPIPLDTLQLEGRLQGNVLDLKTVSIQQAENTATIVGQIDLSTKSTGIINIEHSLNWLYQDQTIQTQGLISGTWGSTDFAVVGTSPVELELDGHLDGLMSDSMSWSSNLSISDTSSLNLTDQPVVINSASLNSQGHYTPSAGVESINVEIDGVVNGSSAQFPSWQAQTKFQLEDQSLNIETLNLQSLINDHPLAIDLTGTLQFPSFIDASLENSVANLSGNWTSLTWPLQAQPALVTSNGKFSAIGPLNNIHILASSEGDADEHSVVANLDLLIGTSSIVVNNFELSADSSDMQASGIINDQIQLTWALSSNDLSSIFTDISGQIDGSGTLSGERDNPKLLFRAQTPGLTNGQFSTGAAKIFADASLADQTEALTVSIAAENFQFDQQPVIESFNLEIDGSTQEHTLTIDSQLAKGASAQVSRDWSLGKLPVECEGK